MNLRRILTVLVSIALAGINACGSDRKFEQLNPIDDPSFFDPTNPANRPIRIGELSFCIPSLHPTQCQGIDDADSAAVGSAVVAAPPPGTVIICDSIATGFYDPMSCLDVSAEVAGGFWTPNRARPLGGWDNIIIFVNNVPRMRGLQVNGVTITGFCPVASGAWDYEVASMMFGRDQDGTIIVFPNPTCTDTLYTARIVANGDSAQAVFDEVEVLGGGTLMPTIPTRLQSSLLLNPTLAPPGNNVLVDPMVFDPALNAFVADFEIGATQEVFFRVLRADPNPLAPPGSFKPIHATHFRIMNGAAVTCSTEMVFYTDLNSVVGQVDQAHRITGVDPNPAVCATQGAENRATVPDFTG